MILVGTSVWISLLQRKPRAWLDRDRLLKFVTCGPILQEVFQGVREDSLSSAFRKDMLAIPRLSDPIPHVPVWHSGRDYSAIAGYTSLRAYTGTTSR